MKKIMSLGITFLFAVVILLSGCTEDPTDTSTIDSDGDGYYDAVDAFPNDNTEWLDSDSDGVGDNTDAFPFDSSEWDDSDDDGVGDNADAFPLDPLEWQDSDGDGVGDNTDAFPLDSMEWLDSDGDGIGNNADYYPYDETRWEPPAPDPFLEQAEPFIQKLALDDSEVRNYAESIISNCDPSDVECKINALYRDILMNYTCTSDPINSGNLQTPKETIQRKEGSCEDLSILLCSLLHNIEINSYLVFTDDHVYALAYDVDSDTLWDHAEQSLIFLVEEQFGEPMIQPFIQTFNLDPLNIWYAGGEEGKTFAGLIKYMTIDYSIQSDKPLHMYVVPTYADFYYFSIGDITNFTHYGTYEEIGLTNKSGSIDPLITYGGILLVNEGAQAATISVDFLFTFQPKFYDTYNENMMTIYAVNGADSVLLDPSLGEYGFPGYDAEISGDKTYIDPVSLQYALLS